MLINSLYQLWQLLTICKSLHSCQIWRQLSDISGKLKVSGKPEASVKPKVLGKLKVSGKHDCVFQVENSLVGGFLFSKISETPIVHVPKLFPLLHWFQNTFCFLSSSTPSNSGNFFMKISQKLWPKKRFSNKNYQHGKELSYRENKMCSETSEAVGTCAIGNSKIFWIRITLVLTCCR